jgi:hypothetical protein
LFKVVAEKKGKEFSVDIPIDLSMSQESETLHQFAAGVAIK